MQTRIEKMQPIKMINDNDPIFKDFLEKLNQEIVELNQLIHIYNEEKERSKKIEKLQAVCRRKEEIESKFSDGQVWNSAAIVSPAEYNDVMHNTLFVELQKQFQSLGISSMLDVTTLDPAAEVFNPGPAHNMEEILANMTPRKTRKMLTSLTAQKGATSYNFGYFNQLYSKNDEGVTVFQKFLKNNKITELGGTNSRNFIITPNEKDAAIQVLKIEDRKATPRTVEDFLRARSLKYVLTGVTAQRSVRGDPDTRTLLITEYCPGGSIDNHSKTLTDNGARLQSALSIYSQMAGILFNIQKDGCAFPDMKNNNWLLDADNMVRMHDGKSLLKTYDGNIDIAKSFAERYAFLKTNHLSPPEFDNGEPFSADKAHAYILGKNLYQYLTNSDLKEYVKKHDAAEFDFNNPIFEGEKGSALKALIIALVKPNPADRKSIKEALTELNRIQDMLLHTKCLRLINELQSQCANAQEYCQNMRKNLSDAYSDNTLREIIDSVNQRSRCEEVRKKVDDLRSGALKGDPSIEEFYQRTREELSSGAMSLARHAEVIEESNQLVIKRMNLVFLQRTIEKLSSELQERYPLAARLLVQQNLQSTDLAKLKKNADKLKLRLSDLLSDDCRNLVNEVALFDITYAQTAEENFLEAQKKFSVTGLMKIRDEMTCSILLNVQASDQKYVDELSDLLDDLSCLDLVVPDLLQFTMDMQAKLREPQTREERLATGEHISKIHAEQKQTIYNNCQVLMREINEEFENCQDTVLMQQKLVDRNITDCKKIEKELTDFKADQILKNVNFKARQVVREECRLLIKQIIQADPEKQTNYQLYLQQLYKETSLDKLKEHKVKLTSDLTQAQNKVGEQQKQLQLLRVDIDSHLNKIQNYLPGGSEGENYCKGIRTKLQTANLAEANNVLVEVKQYCAENTEKRTKELDVCNQLIIKIREADWKNPSIFEDLRVELQTNTPTLPRLQELKSNLTDHFNRQLTKKCTDIIQTIHNKSSTQDRELKLYLLKMRNKVDNSKSEADYNQIRNDLIAVRDDPATRIINEIILNFRNDSGFWSFFSIGKDVKADNIAKALFNVPVKERASILTDSKSKTALKVREELARHRYGCFEGDVVHTDNKGQVIEDKAADSFKFFKREILKAAPKSAAPANTGKSALRG